MRRWERAEKRFTCETGRGRGRRGRESRRESPGVRFKQEAAQNGSAARLTRNTAAAAGAGGPAGTREGGGGSGRKNEKPDLGCSSDAGGHRPGARSAATLFGKLSPWVASRRGWPGWPPRPALVGRSWSQRAFPSPCPPKGPRGDLVSRVWAVGGGCSAGSGPGCGLHAQLRQEVTQGVPA